MSAWIKCSERLPEANPKPPVGYEGLSVEVLVYSDGDVEAAARDLTEGGWYSVQRAVYLNDAAITHWMPMPAPPEGHSEVRS